MMGIFPVLFAVTFVLASLALPSTASAHSFGVVYSLPVPFWLYGWASAVTLILSFVIVGIFATHDPDEAKKTGNDQ